MTNPLFHYLLIHWLIAFIPIGLGLFVYLKDRSNPLYQAFLRYNCVISWWGIFTLFMEYSSNEKTALFWDRVSLLGIVFIPAAFLHFTWMYSGKSKFYDFGIRICYALSSLFFMLAFTPSMAVSATKKYVIPYFTDPGFAYHFFVAYFSLVMTFGNILVFRAWKSCQNRSRKNGIFIFLIATTISTVGGGGNFGVPYQIYTPVLFPYGGYTFIIYGVLIAYTILRHRFLDIEVIIKRTIVFAGLFAMVMAVVGVVTTIMQSYVSRFVHLPDWVAMVFAVMFAISLYGPTRRFLVFATDKYLFQKKEDIKVILNRLAENVIKILDVDQLSRTILDTLEGTLRLESGALFVKEGEGGNYRAHDAFGVDRMASSLKSDDKLIQFFQTRRQIFNAEDHTAVSALPQEIKEELAALKARQCLPLYVSDDLTGLLILGKKKSDQDFTRDELDYFPTVASQCAVALSNAKLFKEVLKERESKLAAQAEAKMVSYAKTIAHEIKNALVGVTSSAVNLMLYPLADLRKIRDKIPQDLLPFYDRACNQIEKLAGTIEVNGTKIEVIAKTAEGTLSSDKGKFSKIYFRILWEAALQDSGVKDCDVEAKYPRDYTIYGNVVLLQRLFVNLLRNAAEAMEGRTEKKIRLVCDYQEWLGKKSAYFEFTDNGPGIPVALKDKIFEQGFSTKAKPAASDIYASGHGHGLYMCREIVEVIHHGKIVVENEMGGGAKFLLWIPMESAENEESEAA